jgi:hypothetical protein
MTKFVRPTRCVKTKKVLTGLEPSR